MGCIQSKDQDGMKTNGKIHPEIFNDNNNVNVVKNNNNVIPTTQDDILKEAAKAQQDDNQRRMQISNNTAATTTTNVNTNTNNNKIKTKLNLIKASKNGNLEIVKEIIQDIQTNTTNSIYNINQLGMWDNTPLICACQYGHEAIAIELLRNGANPNSINEKGCTALLHASMEGLLNVVIEILKHGGNTNLIPLTSIYNQHMDVHEPYTPLLASVTNSSYEITKQLLLNNASIDVLNTDGKNILEIAIYKTKCENTILSILSHCNNNNNNTIIKLNDHDIKYIRNENNNNNQTFQQVMKYINEEMKNDSRKVDGDEVMKVKEDDKMNNVNPNDSNDNINSIPMMQVKEVNDDEMNTAATTTTTTTPIKISKDNETRHVAMTPVVLKID